MDFLVLGEPEFVVGQEYFVFLDNGPRGWRLQMMAWGVFETQFKKGSSYLVPIEASNEFQIAEKNDYTPLKVYPKDALIRLLNGYLNNKYIWDESMTSELKREQHLHIAHFWLQMALDLYGPDLKALPCLLDMIPLVTTTLVEPILK